ncbi:MAG TPA: glycoside hydrolase family 3 protein [Terracidiphilus sp.]|jgi:beta-N-acetylhexosaminidase
MLVHRNSRRVTLRNAVLLILLITAQPLLMPAANPVHLDHKGEHWAASTLRKMTIEEKIGQMIMVWAHVQFLNVQSPDYLQLIDEMNKYHVGGFGVTVVVDETGLVRSQPFEAAFLTNSLQRQSKFPLLFAADFERGLGMRLSGATDFPAAMAFGAAGDPELARNFGRISALESRAIGIQWNWFPVADVNSNPANPIINTRSFGEDPARVSAMIDAYIEGARSEGLLTTVKHFPGHGDTDTDSHLALARVTASVDRLNSLELIPFRNAIKAGVDSVMVGHLTVPSIEPDPNRPASISSHVITGLLKDQLGFRGLVVTDALDMNGLKQAFSGSEADIAGQEAVEAVLAGNDMVIIPGDLDGAYNGLLQAVKLGKVPEKRIDESVLKILRLKASVGLNRDRFVKMDSVAEAVATPESLATAQTISDRAITLVEDKTHLVPLQGSSTAGMQKAGVSTAKNQARTVAVVFTDLARGSDGSRAFVSELRNRVPDATIFHVDISNAGYVSTNVLDAVKKADRVIVVAESIPSPRRTTKGKEGGSVGLDIGPMQVLSDIIANAGEKTIVAAFGNPYVGLGIPGIQSYLCTFSNTPGSAKSLVSALFGETPIHGRLPVTLPGVAQRQTGLDLESTQRQAKPGND